MTIATSAQAEIPATDRFRKASERFASDFGWLKSRHTFSFGSHVDSNWMGFGPLRVINDDRVDAGAGFGRHGHRDMEIISYVLSGALAHKDSLGTGSEIRPQDVQRMSAGYGVEHSEFNASDSDEVRFLQIWIEPDQRGLTPSYEQKTFPKQPAQQGWQLLVSGFNEEGIVGINRGVRMLATRPEQGKVSSYALAPGRRAWLQVVDGNVEIAGRRLSAGDGLGLEAISVDRTLAVRAEDAEAHVLLFDLD